MILPIAIKADWDLIRNRKQKEIDRNNARENRSRVAHEYKEGDQVYVKKPGILRKLEAPREGPYPISKVFNNGTVDVKRGAVTERTNMRRITPHFE